MQRLLCVYFLPFSPQRPSASLQVSLDISQHSFQPVLTQTWSHQGRGGGGVGGAARDVCVAGASIKVPLPVRHLYVFCPCFPSLHLLNTSEVPPPFSLYHLPNHLFLFWFNTVYYKENRSTAISVLLKLMMTILYISQFKPSLHPSKNYDFFKSDILCGVL